MQEHLPIGVGEEEEPPLGAVEPVRAQEDDAHILHRKLRRDQEGCAPDGRIRASKHSNGSPFCCELREDLIGPLAPLNTSSENEIACAWIRI